MRQALTDDKSTLVQVMAWCRQATSHYLISVDQDPQRHMVSLGPNELKFSTTTAVITAAIIELKL